MRVLALHAKQTIGGVATKQELEKTKEQLEQMKRDDTICRECGATSLETKLDMGKGNEAAELASNIITDMLGQK